MDEGIEEMTACMRMAASSGAYSDLTIQCGSKQWTVHKLILCTRSEYFAAACKPNAFKEGDMSLIRLVATTDEGHADDIGADDPEAVRCMVNFLYRHDYTPARVHITSEEANQGMATKVETPTRQNNYHQQQTKPAPVLKPSGDCNTAMHAKVYALGSKYGIRSLQAVAKIKFAEAATYAWNNSTFIEAIDLVYKNTPDDDKGLRDIVARTIIDHSAVLTPKAGVEACVRNIDGLAFDLLKLKSTSKPDVDGPSCNKCGSSKVGRCPYCCQHIVSCDCNTESACSKCQNRL